MSIYRFNNKYYYFFITLASVLSLIVSQTRGAWIAFIIGLTFFSFLTKKRILFVLLILFIIIVLVFPSFQLRFNSIFNIDDYPDNERLLIWESAFEMWKDSPILGHGIGSFEKLYQEKYILEEAKVKIRRFAHSNIFNLLAEAGILGLLSYLCLFISLFKYGFLKLEKIKNKSGKSISITLKPEIIFRKTTINKEVEYE